MTATTLWAACHALEVVQASGMVEEAAEAHASDEDSDVDEELPVRQPLPADTEAAVRILHEAAESMQQTISGACHYLGRADELQLLADALAHADAQSLRGGIHSVLKRWAPCAKGCPQRAWSKDLRAKHNPELVAAGIAPIVRVRSHNFEGGPVLGAREQIDLCTASLQMVGTTLSNVCARMPGAKFLALVLLPRHATGAYAHSVQSQEVKDFMANTGLTEGLRGYLQSRVCAARIKQYRACQTLRLEDVDQSQRLSLVSVLMDAIVPIGKRKKYWPYSRARLVLTWCCRWRCKKNCHRTHQSWTTVVMYLACRVRQRQELQRAARLVSQRHRLPASARARLRQLAASVRWRERRMHSRGRCCCTQCAQHE